MYATIFDRAQMGNRFWYHFVSIPKSGFMRFVALVSAVLALIPAAGLCQLPSSRCDAMGSALMDCPYLTLSATEAALGEGPPHAASPFDQSAVPADNTKAPLLGATSSELHSASIIGAQEAAPNESFHWGRALLESFMFLSIEQAYVVKDDWRWVTIENGVPFNHYWRDYKQSLQSWVDAGWNDGDDPLYNYLGHPIQGALTSYIQIQNDPQGRNLEFSNTKEYWWSRLKATMWNAAYSTQWSIGPLSELTVEKYGSKARPPWNRDATWPCKSKNCYTGVGQVNLVITPLGGLGWLVGEDLLDKHVVRRVEGSTHNRFLVDITRLGLNPIRGGANILHGKRPWYRASRDIEGVGFSEMRKNDISSHETTSHPQSH